MVQQALPDVVPQCLQWSLEKYGTHGTRPRRDRKMRAATRLRQRESVPVSLRVKSRYLPLNGLGISGLFQRIQKRPYTRVIIQGKGIRSKEGRHTMTMKKLII